MPKERGRIWEPEGDEIRSKAVGGRKIWPKARGWIGSLKRDEIRPKAVGGRKIWRKARGRSWEASEDHEGQRTNSKHFKGATKSG